MFLLLMSQFGQFGDIYYIPSLALVCSIAYRPGYSKPVSAPYAEDFPGPRARSEVIIQHPPSLPEQRRPPLYPAMSRPPPPTRPNNNLEADCISDIRRSWLRAPSSPQGAILHCYPRAARSKRPTVAQRRKTSMFS